MLERESIYSLIPERIILAICNRVCRDEISSMNGSIWSSFSDFQVIFFNLAIEICSRRKSWSEKKFHIREKIFFSVFRMWFQDEVFFLKLKKYRFSLAQHPHHPIRLLTILFLLIGQNSTEVVCCYWSTGSYFVQNVCLHQKLSTILKSDDILLFQWLSKKSARLCLLKTILHEAGVFRLYAW